MVSFKESRSKGEDGRVDSKVRVPIHRVYRLEDELLPYVPNELSEPVKNIMGLRDEMTGEIQWEAAVERFVEPETRDLKFLEVIQEDPGNYLGGYILDEELMLVDDDPQVKYHVRKGFGGCDPPSAEGANYIEVYGGQGVSLGVRHNADREVDAVYIAKPTEQGYERYSLYKLESLKGLRMNILFSERINYVDQVLRDYDGPEGIANINQLRLMFEDQVRVN